MTVLHLYHLSYYGQAGLHMLVEKPISIAPAEEVMRLASRLEQLQQEKGLVISVGYQMRYLPAVKVIDHNTLTL